MAIYPGRRQETFRVVVWAKNRSHEWIFEGTKTDAKKFEAEKRLELRAGVKSATRGAPTFFEFSTADYRPHALAHLGADTWHKVRKYQVATLIEFFGSTKLDELSSELIDEYKDERAEEVERSSVNNELRVLRAMLNWGRDVRKLPIASFKIEMLPIKGVPRVKVWTPEQVAAFYAKTRELEPQLMKLFIFMFNTGVRKGEAIASEWSWIDEPAEMVRIRVTDEWSPKSGKERDIPMGDAVRVAISGPKQHERWLFPNQLGERYRYFPKDAFWRVRDAAKLRGGPHTMRHTFASNFLAHTPDLFLLSKLLGHSHTRTTEIYSHLLPKHLERARNAVTLLPETVAKPWRPDGAKARTS
jgi:integrase